MEFTRIKITKIIRDSAKELDIPIVQIFREADVSHRNMEKWDEGTSPTRRTENKILDAIERISKETGKYSASNTINDRSVNA